VSLPADGEDRAGCDGVADRAFVAARVAGYRAIGSAHDEDELAALKAVAQRWLAAGQGELDLGLEAGQGPGPLPVLSARMGHLADAIERGYQVLGLDAARRG
jgi:hypothetical protein